MSGRHLVQVLLPVTGVADRAAEELEAVIHELNDRFGGVTAYTRTPATGLWTNSGETDRDMVVMVEVVVEIFDRDWWAAYRQSLEARFRQDVIHVRAWPVELL